MIPFQLPNVCWCCWEKAENSRLCYAKITGLNRLGSLLSFVTKVQKPYTEVNGKLPFVQANPPSQSERNFGNGCFPSILWLNTWACCETGLVMEGLDTESWSQSLESKAPPEDIAKCAMLCIPIGKKGAASILKNTCCLSGNSAECVSGCFQPGGWHSPEESLLTVNKQRTKKLSPIEHS